MGAPSSITDMVRLQFQIMRRTQRAISRCVGRRDVGSKETFQPAGSRVSTVEWKRDRLTLVICYNPFRLTTSTVERVVAGTVVERGGVAKTVFSLERVDLVGSEGENKKKLLMR